MAILGRWPLWAGTRGEIRPLDIILRECSIYIFEKYITSRKPNREQKDAVRIRFPDFFFYRKISCFVYIVHRLLIKWPLLRGIFGSWDRGRWPL